MSNYRKKPVVIQAHQWFKNGDHPDDGNETFADGEYAGEKYEGRVVRYFRRPDVPGTRQCSACGETFHVHGWIDTLEDGHIVCPGDWIITGVAGERYPCKPHIFDKTYERTDAPAPAQVPDGYVLVPKVPTGDMLAAMIEAFGSGAGSYGEHAGHDAGDAADAFAAMIAEAQKKEES